MVLVDIKKDLTAETLEVFKKSFKSPITLQGFKTMVYNGDFIEGEKRHQEEILTGIIYSQFSEMPDVLKIKRFCMSGFKQQEGRLPTKHDRIRIIRGKHYFERGHDFIISEIGFEVVRECKKQKQFMYAFGWFHVMRSWFRVLEI